VSLLNKLSIQKIITTERLILRPMVLSDVNDLYEYQSDPETVKYIPWPARTNEQVKEAVEKVLKDIKFDNAGDYLNYVWEVKETGKVIGQGNLNYISKEHKRAEVGWVINSKMQGQGYATEATRALINSAFVDHDFHRVIAYIDIRNAESIKLAQRLNLRLEATYQKDEWFKGEWTSAHLFAVLKDEWKSQI
jgi:aminoglycoside 6'-N-acetyltransferase